MTKANIRIQDAASYRLDEIYRYTRDRWGTQQADRYITGLFDAFDGIADHWTSSRRSFSISRGSCPYPHFLSSCRRRPASRRGNELGTGLRRCDEVEFALSRVLPRVIEKLPKIVATY